MRAHTIIRTYRCDAVSVFITDGQGIVGGAGRRLGGNLPDELLYLPATQLVHGPPSGPLKPLLHAQSLAESLPEGELDPAGQVEQVLDVDAPEAAEYLPLPQSVQVDEPAHMQYI